MKKNKSIKQYSARLTRWFDRLNHFDITLKYTARKEIKFTDFIRRNPTEIAEPEKNYEEEFVINAIAQLATANYRIGRIFNQSDHSNTAVMHDTRRTQTGTRCNKTNNHSNFQTTANYINHTVTDNYHLKLEKNQTMDNNNNEDMQEPERYPRDEEGRLKYHWGADHTIMKIIKRKDNSPETRDLVRQRIALTKPGNMHHHYNKKLERQILVPKRPDEEERKEVKRIDLRLKRKEEHRITHIGGGYFKNFCDQSSQEHQEHSISAETPMETNRETESTVSSTPEESVTTQEPGAYPAIPVQEFRDGPIEEIAVPYVRIKRVIENKAIRNKKQEDNVRAAELDFMLDLETLIKETAADPDLIELQCCIEDNNLSQAPEAYTPIIKRLTHRWGITMVDDRIIVPKSLRYAALNALHFGHPGINKMCGDAAIFWWPNMQADIEKKAKTCSACLNAGKNLKCQIPSTEKTKIEPPENPGEEIQIDFTRNLNSKHFEHSPFILVAVDSNSRWPVAKSCKNTNHESVISFLKEYTNIYGVPKSIKTDKGSAFISKEFSKYCNENNITRKYGTANLHTGTGLAERTIQSLKNLLKANLEDGTNLRNSLDKALNLLRFTTHSELRKTPFELHFGRKPRTKLTNLKNAISADSKDLCVYITRSSTGEITDHLVMSKKKTTDPKYRRGMTFSQTKKPPNTVSTNKYPFSFYEKNYKTNSLGSKISNKLQTAISGTKHTVTTDKNKEIHRKLISNPLPFQSNTTPTKRITNQQHDGLRPEHRLR